MLDNLEGVIKPTSSGANTYQYLMKKAVEAAARWLANEVLFDPKAGINQRKILSNLCIFPIEGVGPEKALEEANEYFLEAALQVHNPNCAAHLHCPTVYSSQMAEVLINISNQSMDSFDQSPSATLLEEITIKALAQRIGYDSDASGVFTSGGTQSNLMGLLLARDNFVKQNLGVDIKKYGLQAVCDRLVVLVSDQAHFSIQKSLAILGLGQQAVVRIKSDPNGRLSAQDLCESIRALKTEGATPFAVVATVGTTDRGAIDPIKEISEICKKYGLWLHVDAAWGGALLFSNKYRKLIDGVEQADSITLDFHKHFFQTISCGAFLLRDSQHFDLIKLQADYLNPIEDEDEGIINLVSISLQTTRRFDALKLLMSMRSLGTKYYGELIDRTIDLAVKLSGLISLNSRLELLCPPVISSVLFRRRISHLTEKEADNFQRRVAKALLDQGRANIGITRFEGRVALKITLLNPEATTENLHELVEIIANI